MSVQSSPRPARDEFLSFVSDISVAVSEHLAAAQDTRPSDAAGDAPAVAAAVARFLLDREKIIWHWPEIAARLTEDVR